MNKNNETFEKKIISIIKWQTEFYFKFCNFGA